MKKLTLLFCLLFLLNSGLLGLENQFDYWTCYRKFFYQNETKGEIFTGYSYKYLVSKSCRITSDFSIGIMDKNYGYKFKVGFQKNIGKFFIEPGIEYRYKKADDLNQMNIYIKSEIWWNNFDSIFVSGAIGNQIAEFQSSSELKLNRLYFFHSLEYNSIFKNGKKEYVNVNLIGIGYETFKNITIFGFFENIDYKCKNYKWSRNGRGCGLLLQQILSLFDCKIMFSKIQEKDKWNTSNGHSIKIEIKFKK